MYETAGKIEEMNIKDNDRYKLEEKWLNERNVEKGRKGLKEETKFVIKIINKQRNKNVRF